MKYEYSCPSCSQVFDGNFPMGTASATVVCPRCKKQAHRYFGGMSFVLKGGGFPSQSMKFNKEMTEKNAKAGRRMKDNVPGLRRVATDYGNGDIRPV